MTYFIKNIFFPLEESDFKLWNMDIAQFQLLYFLKILFPVCYAIFHVLIRKMLSDLCGVLTYMD